MATQVQASPQQRASKRPGLTTLILAALLLGVAWGLLLGEYGAWVQWIGDAYVGLLQMTVLPYVAVSLTCNIARLSVSQSGRVARVALGVLLLLWTIGLVALAVMTLSFPEWQAGSFFSTALINEPTRPDWLALFIPANPFWSLTNNMIPAVVLFSIGLGVALIPVSNKELLLEKLDVLTDGLRRLNHMVVQLSPIGIFAIVGHTTGTISLENFTLIQGYLLVYVVAAVLLTFWVLPALIACGTPFSQRQVLQACRDALITAFILGNTFAVLPMIIDAVKRLTAGQDWDTRDGYHAPEYTVQLAYPFPDIGRIVGLVFIPFAAWFYGTEIDPACYPQLVGTGFLGSFAKPVVTVPLLLNVAEIPADIFNLYLAVGVVSSRFGDLMKTMHLFTFSILTACYLAGAARFQFGRLLGRGAITVLLFAVSVVSIRSFLLYSFQDDYSREKLLVARPRLGAPAEATILERSEPNPMPLDADEDRLDRILRRGAIRIGFNADRLPFAYFNQEQQLVGFDMDMANQLARDLGVRIEFVPFATNVAEPLRADHFDIAMSGLEGTIKRATELPEMDPYMEVTRALVVPDHRRHQFRSLQHLANELRGEPPLRVAVIVGSIASETPETDAVLGEGWGAVNASGVAHMLQRVELGSAREFFESSPPVADVLATSAEEGSAWTLKYPRFAVVKPKGIDAQTPLYYFVFDQSRLREFIDSWLELKRRDGTIRQLYDYWILGLDRQDPKPRWCIIRNVLGWVD